MKITEAERVLPNGLHDATLLEVKVDYSNRTAALQFIADYSDPDHKPNPPDRKVMLRVSGVHFIDVPAPDLKNKYGCDGPADVAGFLSLEDSEYINADVLEAAKHLPRTAFCEAIFVTDWNDFIVIAAEDARIEIE